MENSQANKNDYLALKEATDSEDSSNLPSHLKGSYDLIMQYKADGKSNIKAWSENAVFLEGIKAAVDESSVYNDMAFFGRTKTMDTKWANLTKLENETFVKIVMGQEDISTFDKFVSDWKAQGGDEITKEVNEEAN